MIQLAHQRKTMVTNLFLFLLFQVSILETFSKFSKLIEENFDEQELTVIGCSNMEVLAVTLSSLSIAK
jgi:hypothetical protein